MMSFSDSSPSPSSVASGLRHRIHPLFFWLLAIAVGLVVLLAPALWNGGAISFYDTGGYIEAAVVRHLVAGRSLFYGLFLGASTLGWQSFWGPILVQALMTLWLLHLVCRCHGVPAGPWALIVGSCGLAGLTGISWYVSQLMPDLFLALTTLVLWLFALHWRHLSWLERGGLALIALLGMLSHMSCLALAIGLVLVLLAARLLLRRWLPGLRWLPPAAVVMAALVLMPFGHRLITGQNGFTPGGTTFLFGRLVQDGLAKQWLDAYCPQPGISLCGMRERLPTTADDFLWHEHSPFQDMGGWRGNSEPEIKRLVRLIVTSYPGKTLWTAVRSTVEQLGKVATGDALDESHSDTRGTVNKYLNHLGQTFFGTRQQQGELSQAMFARLNLVHVPVGLASMALLPVMAWWLWRRRRLELAGLTLFVLVALMGNACICGALSNPHDRYQSRLIWMAPLVLGMGMMAGSRRQLEQPPG